MAILDVDSWSVTHWQRYAYVCAHCRCLDATVSVRAAATAYANEKLHATVLLCNGCVDGYYAYWSEPSRTVCRS